LTKKDFQRLLDRDQGYCLHCGTTEALAPNHRSNRGMGGSKLADVPSNLVLICSMLNGQLEADERYYQQGLQYGWKVSKWADWRTIPVYDAMTGVWYLLNDDWTRNVVDERNL
jgi:hypothetical protein